MKRLQKTARNVLTRLREIRTALSLRVIAQRLTVEEQAALSAAMARLMDAGLTVEEAAAGIRAWVNDYGIFLDGGNE